MLVCADGRMRIDDTSTSKLIAGTDAAAEVGLSVVVGAPPNDTGKHRCFDSPTICFLNNILHI
jgi:hypothetical protein